MKYEHITHPIEPFFTETSRILILGSFPSVKSREQMFFYGHPQNRFWKVLAMIFSEEVPGSIEEKKALLRNHDIALYDVIESCDIVGSSDSSIKNVKPTDLNSMIEKSQIEKIFCNGKASFKFFKKYQEERTGMVAEVLPSTSPANAAWSLERLVEEWQEQGVKSL